MFWKHRRSFAKAQEALEKNDYPAAEEKLTQLLTADPDAIEALLHRALTRLRLRRADEALQDALRAAELRPENAVAFMVCGEVLLSLHRYEEAYDKFRHACSIERDNGRAFYGWAKACIALQKKEEAADYFEIALQFERDYVYAQVFSELMSRT